MGKADYDGWVRYAIGTPDCISHLAEEIPRPAHNLPKAIGAQMAVGFITFVTPLLCFIGVRDHLLTAPMIQWLRLSSRHLLLHQQLGGCTGILGCLPACGYL
jgi:amino acid transporter